MAATGVTQRQLYQTRIAKTTASQTVASTAAETFFNSNQQYSILQNRLRAGDRLRIRAGGVYGLDVGSTIDLRLYIGPSNFIDTGAQLPSTSASLNRNWLIEGEIFIATAGVSGTFYGGGHAVLPTSLVTPQTKAGSAIDTTDFNDVTVSVQFSASTSTNRAQMRYLFVEIT